MIFQKYVIYIYIYIRILCDHIIGLFTIHKNHAKKTPHDTTENTQISQESTNIQCSIYTSYHCTNTHYK